MAKLYIREFQSPPDTDGLPVEDGDAIDQAPITIGASSVASAAFNTSTRYVLLATDVICSIVFGTAPTATASNLRLAAGATYLAKVRAGLKVAVITNT